MGLHNMEPSMIGNVNSWVESFLEAAVILQQEEEKTAEEKDGGEILAEEDTEEEKSCLVATWRCFSSVLEQAVRHSCRPAGLTRCR